MFPKCSILHVTTFLMTANSIYTYVPLAILMQIARFQVDLVMVILTLSLCSSYKCLSNQLSYWQRCCLNVSSNPQTVRMSQQTTNIPNCDELRTWQLFHNRHIFYIFLFSGIFVYIQTSGNSASAEHLVAAFTTERINIVKDFMELRVTVILSLVLLKLS